MKKLVTLAAILGVSSFLVACSTDTHVKKDETIDGSYILVSANDQALPNTIPPVINLSVSDDFTQVKITGKMCNVFNGDAAYQDGVLQGDFMMTRALCDEPALNALDKQVSDMFAQGTQVEKTGDQLVLKSGDHTLVYKAVSTPAL